MVTVIADSMQEHVQAWRLHLRSLTPVELHKLGYVIRSVLNCCALHSYLLRSLLPWLNHLHLLLLNRYFPYPFPSCANSQVDALAAALAVRQIRHALSPYQYFQVEHYFPQLVLPLPCQLPSPITSISLPRSCPLHQLHRCLAQVEVELAAHSVVIKPHRRTLS